MRIEAIWLFAVPGLIWGQTEASSAFRPLSAAQGGVHLQSVSVYSGYYSSGSPSGFEAAIQSPFLSGPSAMGGVAATFGGSKQGEKSTFSWNYSPSYFNLFYANDEASNNGSLNHRGGVGWSRKLGGKWTFSTSVNGYIANLEQLYFNPSVLTSVASMPTTFDDLAAGMLTGKFTDAQLASLLTGAPLQASPEQAYLYGQRMLNAAANIELAWAPTARTSLALGVSGARMEHLNGVGAGQAASSSGGYLAPQATTTAVRLSWSYSLSPRTQIGVEASSMRTFSSIQKGYATHASFSVGRTMSRRWFVGLKGGAGKLTYASQAYANPKAIQYLYGASLGFKTYAHTFLVSYERSLGDGYGLGSSTTGGAIGTWNWRPPGRSWSASANGGYQELNNLVFENTRSWHAGAGVAKSLSAHLFVSVNYIYLQMPVNLITAGLERTQKGVLVSMTWSPSGYQ